MYMLSSFVVILKVLINWIQCQVLKMIASDLIAIPDFVSGAMEHWGLITFREVNMLFDPMEASSANQQRVAVVVAHEIAHQVK